MTLFNKQQPPHGTPTKKENHLYTNENFAKAQSFYTNYTTIYIKDPTKKEKTKKPTTPSPPHGSK